LVNEAGKDVVNELLRRFTRHSPTTRRASHRGDHQTALVSVTSMTEKISAGVTPICPGTAISRDA
jgi:hypothetical protein